MIGQATANAPRPRSARETVRGEAGNSVQSAPNLDAPRFFVQMGFAKLDVDTAAVPNGYLLRGEITPCRSYRQKASVYEIPEGQRIPGMDEADRGSNDRRIVWGYYWKHAQFEADRLIENETQAVRKMGLYAIKSLSGYRTALYDQYDFNAIFYPDGLENLPATNEGLEAHLTARVGEIEAMNLPAELKPVLAELGAELIAAVKHAQKIQSDRIDFSHRCMQLSPDDKSGYYKKEYDEIDEEMLARTGKARVGEALETQAKALHLLAEDKATPKNDPFAALARAQEEQNQILRQQLEMQAAQNAKLMEMLMAQQQPKEEKPEAPTKANVPQSNAKR